MTLKGKIRGDKIYTKLIQTKLKKYDHELERNKEFLKNLDIVVNDFEPIINYTQEEVSKVERIFPLVSRSIPRHAFILYVPQGCAFLLEVNIIITVGVCHIYGSGKYYRAIEFNFFE